MVAHWRPPEGRVVVIKWSTHTSSAPLPDIIPVAVTPGNNCLLLPINRYIRLTVLQGIVSAIYCTPPKIAVFQVSLFCLQNKRTYIYVCVCVCMYVYI